MTTATERAIAAREKKSREAWEKRYPDWEPSGPDVVEKPKAKKPAAKS